MATAPLHPSRDDVAAVPGARASWIAGLADPDQSDAERVDRIRLLEELKSQAAAAQARLAVDLDDSLRAQHAAARLPAVEHGRGVAAQVALARGESPSRGSRHLGLARALVGEMPRTLAALESGVLSEYRATLVARETGCLSRADRSRVDEALCAATGDGGYRFEGWGDRRLVAETQKLAYRIDPLAVVNRAGRAESERRVTLRPAPDTMSRLTGLLPAAAGVAVWATLSRLADQLTASGDGRSRGQIMADALVERVTGQSEADAVPVAVNLTVSDETLLAGGHEPAWLEGFGPIPPNTVRSLIGTALADAWVTLRRVYVSPESGQLVAADSKARDFPTGLGLFIDLRDQVCRTPWCDAPIRHKDHVLAWAAGGETSLANGQGLCEQCNYVKQAPGWRSRPVNGPPDGPHTVEVTTPTGHAHLSASPDLPRPARLVPVSRVEMYAAELVLAG